MIRKRMSATGAVVTQSSSPFFTRRTFWCINATVDHVFDDTLSYHQTVPSFGLWGFNLARKGAQVPRQFHFTVATRFITDEAMQASMIFGKDIALLDSPVNSIMEPKLYQLYIEDLKP